MWLKRLLQNKTASPSGGAGSDLGVGSDNVMGLSGGQSGIFEAPDREEQHNEGRRQRQRRMMERKRKWRLSKDQPRNQQL